MKKIILLAVATLGFSWNASAMVPPIPETFVEVDGIKAQFLYETVLKFDKIPGLEGTSEGALGTYYGAMFSVICDKNFEKEPVMRCSIGSTADSGKMVTVDQKKFKPVSDLRRALIEITGRLQSFKESNVIRIRSISCEARRVNVEMDELEMEPTYSCKVGY